MNKWIFFFLNSVYFGIWQSANFIFCQKINMSSMNKTFYYGHFCVKKLKCQIVLIEKIRFCYLSCTKSWFFRLNIANFRCFYSPERGIPYPSSVRLSKEQSTQISENFFECEATLNKQIAGNQFKARAQYRLYPFSHIILSMTQ